MAGDSQSQTGFDETPLMGLTLIKRPRANPFGQAHVGVWFRLCCIFGAVSSRVVFPAQKVTWVAQQQVSHLTISKMPSEGK